jgi:WD40 repeat protein
MWDFAQKKKMWSLNSSSKPINFLLRPGSNYILASNSTNQQYVDMTTGLLLHEKAFPLDKVTTIFAELMHGLVACAMQDGTVEVWNYEKQTKVGQLDPPTDNSAPHTYIFAMALLSYHNKDGYVFAVGDGFNGQVCFWSLEIDAASGSLSTNWWRGCKQIHTGSMGMGITAMAGSVTDGHLATGAKDGSIVISNIDFDLTNGYSMIKFSLVGHTDKIVGLVYMGDDEMVSADSSGLVMVWNTMMGSPVRVLTALQTSSLVESGFGIVPSTDGVTVMAGTLDGVKQLDLVTDQVLYTIPNVVSGSLLVMNTPGMYWKILFLYPVNFK